MRDLPRGRWSLEVHNALVDMLLTTPPGAVAAFDWDDTCTRGDLGELMLSEVASPEQVQQYDALMDEEDQLPAYALLTQCMAGTTPFALRRRTEEALARAMATGRIAFRPEVRSLVWAMQRLGWQVYVVTGSPGTVIETAAQHYGIATTHVIGMRLTIRQGVFTDEIAGPITYRQGKVDALRLHTDAPIRFAAGDSGGDLELLGSASTSLLMDRGVAGLRDHAITEGWLCQDAF